MAILSTAVITPGRALQSVAVTTSLVEVPDNNVSLYVGATVGEYRATEILNAWRWLWAGVRDRNILQQFAGVIYSGCDIDFLGEPSRITSATYGDFGDDDVFVGIGQLVVAEMLDYTLPIETAFQACSDRAQELQFKV